MHFVVLNEDVPCEIEAVIDGRTYYWRCRYNRWSLYHHVVDSVVSKNILIQGATSIDDERDLISYGVQHIMDYHNYYRTSED
jgi:hypothetical protein